MSNRSGEKVVVERPRSRRTYTEEFQSEAVQMLLDGHTAAWVCDRLGPAADAQRQRGLFAAYHPVQCDRQAALDVWYEPLRTGEPLPTMPLFLLGSPCIPVDLSDAYQRTCEEQRIPVA